MENLGVIIAGVYSITSELAFTFVGNRLLGKLAPAKSFLGKARNLVVAYTLAITAKSLIADKAAESAEATANLVETAMDYLEDKLS